MIDPKLWKRAGFLLGYLEAMSNLINCEWLKTPNKESMLKEIDEIQNKIDQELEDMAKEFKRT